VTKMFNFRANRVWKTFMRT